MSKFQTTFLLLIVVLFNVSFAQTSVYLDSTASVDDRVKDLLSRMTQDEKIGQMLQVDHTVLYKNREDVTNYFIGSVLSGGSSECGDNTPESWANLYDSLQQFALNTRLKIPMLYGIDAVHGHNNVYGATMFPHNIGLGCTGNPELVEQAARITAIEIAATGIDWTFAPCIAVPQDENWGRYYEGFGETPEFAKAMGSAQVKGFQGNSLSDPTSVLACAKHYLGDGGTKGGDDQGNTIADEKTIREIHLPGYISAIDAGAATIMVSYSSINGNKMHGSKYWINDVLKNELGFKGIVVSDWAGVDQVNRRDYKDAVEKAVNAGIDMIMLPRRYKACKEKLDSLIAEGKVQMSRIDDAVSRILRIKFEMGLFERPFTDRSLLSTVGSKEHREVARQAVRESLVLLKNEDKALPLPKTDTKILVAGSHADNIGYQCGGWTIAWMGDSGKVTTGTTILEGLKNAAPSANIQYSIDGNFTENPDYSILVIGEKPYAEGTGDSLDLNVSAKNVELIKKLKSSGSKVIVILISGRPLMIENIIDHADAIVAAWLPGSEGDGIADVIFGDFAPKGRLNHSWPRSMDQVPINVGDENYDPLFKLGYGITTF